MLADGQCAAQTNAAMPPAAGSGCRRLERFLGHLAPRRAGSGAAIGAAAAVLPSGVAASAMEVTSVEVRTVGPEVARFRWDDALPEFFCTNTVVRIRTVSGLEGCVYSMPCHASTHTHTHTHTHTDTVIPT